MPSLCIRLFGSPQVSVDGARIDIPRDKSLAVLVYLAVTQTPQRRDRMAALFWPESRQSSARAYLRNALYTLTQTIGSNWFRTDRKQIALDPDMDWRTDVAQFEDRVKDWRTDSSLDALNEAAALAQDDFAAGFCLADSAEFDNWLLIQRENLRRKVDSVLSTLVEASQADGQLTQALKYAQRRAAMDRLNESAQCALMRLYAITGQKAAALRHYANLATHLREELDAEPSDTTLSLYEDIRLDQHLNMVGSTLFGAASVENTGDRLPNQAIRSDGQAPCNLPRPPLPFVGRVRELDELDGLLRNQDSRLITILGPGGMGKTRLALACAERHLQRGTFPNGVHYINLAPLNHVVQIAPSIASAVDCVLLPEDGGRTLLQQLADHLTGKRLLVLDSFEHLVSGANWIHDLLVAAPMLSIFVTSRERLHMYCETVFPIAGLDYGDTDPTEEVNHPDAVKLFLQCAHHQAPEHTLSRDDLADVAFVCSNVEGMPLGIELAASWLGVLSPAEIATEMHGSLDFLDTDMADAPKRHSSIRAVFDATWRSLDVDEQRAFAALSVFRGGFSREAAYEVADARLRQLSRLADKSLLKPNRRRADRPYRYAIHELLRQYAGEMLAQDSGEIESVRERYVAYYARFLRQRLRTMHGPQLAQAMVDIDEDLENIRVVWQMSIDEANVQAIYQSATAYFLYCQQHSLFMEGADAMSTAAVMLGKLDASPIRDATLARLLNHEGWLWMRTGSFARAMTVLEASRSLYAQSGMFPPPHMGSDPASPLAVIAQSRGDHRRALELGEEALQGAIEREDVYNQIYAHYALTSTRAAIGELDIAARHAELAFTLAQAVGNRWFSAIVRNEWGRAVRAAGNLSEAKAHFQGSHDIMQLHGDSEGMAVAQNDLGEVALLQDDPTGAESHFQKAYELYSGINDRVGRATATMGLACVALGRGDAHSAAQHYQKSLTIASETDFLPLLLNLFAHVGELLCACGELLPGLCAVLYAHKHPALYFETRQRTQRILTGLCVECTSEIDCSGVGMLPDSDLDVIIAVLQDQLDRLLQQGESALAEQLPLLNLQLATTPYE